MLPNDSWHPAHQGVDVHKYSHTAVALDCWGQEKDRFEFSNDSLDGYISWLDRLGKRKDVFVALEDVNGYGVHLVAKLAQEGFAIRYVPAILTERDRKRSIHREKGDVLDARRVGKVILNKFEETLPAKESVADEEERTTVANLDFLVAERHHLVADKTVLKNQLHALLHQYFGDHYADGFPKAFTKRAVAVYRGRLRTVDTVKATLADTKLLF